MGHLTYLIFELAWALPVVLLQWAVGYSALWKARRVLIPGIVIPTAYLTATDAVALQQGIWTLHASRIVGVRIGVVPLEEAIFFALTNCLIVQSLIVVRHFLSSHARHRFAVTGGRDNHRIVQSCDKDMAE